MPASSFGNPFAIPQVQVTSLKPQLPDPNASLAALMKLQMAQQRMALAAARAAGGGGGGGKGKMPQEGDPRYGRWAFVPQKDGTKKPVWVWGTSQKERNAAETSVVDAAQREILAGDTALQKDLSSFEGLSVPGRKDVVDRIRQQHAPRLARVLGISGEELSKQLTTGLDKSIRERENAIKDAGLGTQLLYAGKQVFRNIADTIGAIGETPQQLLARGKANAEAAAQDAKENPFVDELQRLKAENRSSAGLQLSNPIRSAAVHATPLAAMIAPAIVGGAIGTAVGGPAGALAGGALGGGIGAGLPAGGEALARVATDENLSEAQKEASAGRTALGNVLTSAALGAIPIGPMSVARPALARAAMTKAIAKKGVPEAVLSRMTPGATEAEVKAATQEWVRQQAGSVLNPGAYTPTLAQQIGLHGGNAAALGGAFQLGSNVAYNLGTGQSLPLTEGLGEAIMGGAVLGLPFGLGARIGAARGKRKPGADPNFKADFRNQPGTQAHEWIDTSKPEVEAAPTHPLYREASPVYPPYREAPVSRDSFAPLSAENRRQIAQEWNEFAEAQKQQPLFDIWNQYYNDRVRALAEQRRAKMRVSPYNGTTENPAPAQNTVVASERSLAERGGTPLVPTFAEHEAAFDEFLAKRPTSKQIVDYVQQRLDDGTLTMDDARALREQHYDSSKKPSKQRVVVKALDKVIKNGDRTGERPGGTDEPVAVVEQNGQVRKGTSAGGDIATDSAVSADPAPVASATADTPVAEIVDSGAPVEGRGNVGTAAPNPRPAETPSATPVEPGVGGEERPDRERSVEPATPPDAERSEGERELEPTEEQRAGDVGDATEANGQPVETSAPRSLDELAAGEKKDSLLRSRVLGGLLGGTITPEEVREYANSGNAKWRKEAVAKALKDYEMVKSVPTTLEGASKEQVKLAKEWVRIEAKAAFRERKMPEEWVNDVANREDWRSMKNALLANDISLSKQSTRLLDELAPAEVAKPVTPDTTLLDQAIRDKFAEILPDKKLTDSAVNDIRTAFVKAALGEKLTSKQNELYQKALKAGIPPLEVNREAIMDAVELDKDRGYDSITPMQEVETSVPESQEKIIENGDKCV